MYESSSVSPPFLRSQAERVKIDIEEAKFQAEERRKAIEKAKTLLYHQTDRVKKFHVSSRGGGGVSS